MGGSIYIYTLIFIRTDELYIERSFKSKKYILNVSLFCADPNVDIDGIS